LLLPQVSIPGEKSPPEEIIANNATPSVDATAGAVPSSGPIFVYQISAYPPEVFACYKALIQPPSTQIHVISPILLSPELLITVRLHQETEYRRDHKGMFSIFLSDKTLEETIEILGPLDEPLLVSYLRIVCFIEGEILPIQKEKIVYHRSIIQFKEGQAFKINPEDKKKSNPKIGLFTIKKNEHRNRRHLIYALLFRDNQLIGKSPETSIFFRPGKKDDG
jgi:hypothetical protein